jgi:hypothetical protein
MDYHQSIRIFRLQIFVVGMAGIFIRIVSYLLTAIFCLSGEVLVVDSGSVNDGFVYKILPFLNNLKTFYGCKALMEKAEVFHQR